MITIENFDFIDRPDNQRIQAMASKYSDVDASYVQLFLHFQWTYREIEKSYNRLLEKFGLTESRFIILMFLYQADQKQLLPSEIAKKLGATRATVSKLIKGLERSSFVTKTTSEIDKRSVYIKITKQGETTLTQFLPYNFESVKQLFSPLSEVEMRDFTSLLNKVLQGKNKLTEMERSINGKPKN